MISWFFFCRISADGHDGSVATTTATIPNGYSDADYSSGGGLDSTESVVRSCCQCCTTAAATSFAVVASTTTAAADVEFVQAAEFRQDLGRNFDKTVILSLIFLLL